MAASLVRLKVTLDHVEPTVMRRIVVPWRIRLSRLHEVLQAAMGWTNTHLYEFQIRDVGFGLPDKEWGDRGGSVCLNSFGRFAKWISASIMPPPSLVSAR
jgi:hypothetical protein